MSTLLQKNKNKNNNTFKFETTGFFFLKMHINNSILFVNPKSLKKLDLNKKMPKLFIDPS